MCTIRSSISRVQFDLRDVCPVSCFTLKLNVFNFQILERLCTESACIRDEMSAG